MQKKVLKDHISFSLEENDVISNLGVKTLIKQKNSVLPLRKIKKNGETILICSTEGLERIGSGGAIASSQAIGILNNLSELLAACEESAFLDCSYIELSKELVFFNEKLGKYCFAVIPVDEEDYNIQQKKFDDRLERFVVELFATVADSSSALENFRREFLNAVDKKSFIKNEVGRITNGKEENTDEIELELEYRGAYGAFSLYICKDEFVIGKSEDCDGVLAMNPTISRHHCVIRKAATGWLLADVGSSNGTYLGNIRLNNQPVMINNNDRIRISDMEFVVRIG